MLYITDGVPPHDWNLTLVFFTPHVLEFSSVLHVALLVFLRLVVVRSPFSEENDLLFYRRILIAIIWMTSIIFNVIPLIFSGLKMLNSFFYTNITNFYCLQIFPVFAIIIMWTVLLWTAKVRKSHSEISLQAQHSMEESNSKRIIEIIRWLVVFLLLSYIPNLIWRQYAWIVSHVRSTTLTSREVKIVSRLI